ncbi:MAG: ABC transporter ATP-binding protein [Eggerthellaceae bacterium]|nr:ABC transporter ATP-binding protein [Eggerthellaceae bacterium]
MNAPFKLVIAGLQKRYGDRTVLDIGDLVLESGHAYALVGHNGSGKSTLCKVVSGVVDQTAGCIDVEGADRNGLAVGYMPQKSYLFGFSVFKNVALALDGSGLPHSEVDKRVKRALEAVGMQSFAQERGSGLSGGEAQRVALARMLVQDLDVLLLDEPTASMDMEGTLLAEAALAAYRDQTGCLLVAATHAPAQALRISDRALMLSSGRVVEFGETDCVLSNPSSEEGRAFLAYWAV